MSSLCITPGGVARDGKDDLPMGRAGLVDKVIGKAEKVGSPLASPLSSSSDMVWYR